jgi:hypothetical protein
MAKKREELVAHDQGVGCGVQAAPIQLGLWMARLLLEDSTAAVRVQALSLCGPLARLALSSTAAPDVKPTIFRLLSRVLHRLRPAPDEAVAYAAALHLRSLVADLHPLHAQVGNPFREEKDAHTSTPATPFAMGGVWAGGCANTPC